MKSKIVKARLLKSAAQQQQPDESEPEESSSGVHTRTKRLREDESVTVRYFEAKRLKADRDLKAWQQN
jgi:hypothetical protein